MKNLIKISLVMMLLMVSACSAGENETGSNGDDGCLITEVCD